MNSELLDKIASQLLDSYVSRQPVEQLTATYPDLTPADAYEIQLRQAATRIAKGARVVGHKVGLTSAPMRRALGVDEPDYGHLFNDMMLTDGAPIDTSKFIALRVEPELAFVLDKPLRGPGVTIDDAKAAIAYGVPALELIDSRIKDWKLTLSDTVADNGSSGAFLLGSQKFGIDDLDLRLMGCLLTHNGKIVETGAGGAVLGHPLTSVAWLANALGPLGVTLEAGHVVMSGSITAPIFVHAGDTVTAEFDRAGIINAKFI